jgi:hypothetical protein
MKSEFIINNASAAFCLIYMFNLNFKRVDLVQSGHHHHHLFAD